MLRAELQNVSDTSLLHSTPLLLCILAPYGTMGWKNRENWAGIVQQSLTKLFDFPVGP